MNYNITEEEKHGKKDRIAYIYLMLRNDKTKHFINNKIVELNITSRSTADREISKIDKWNKATKELFLATYIPTESDRKDVESISGIKASKCTKYDTEASHIINELSAKNEELQKELQYYTNFGELVPVVGVEPTLCRFWVYRLCQLGYTGIKMSGKHVGTDVFTHSTTEFIQLWQDSNLQAIKRLFLLVLAVTFL